MKRILSFAIVLAAVVLILVWAVTFLNPQWSDILSPKEVEDLSEIDSRAILFE